MGLFGGGGWGGSAAEAESNYSSSLGGSAGDFEGVSFGGGDDRNGGDGDSQPSAPTEMRYDPNTGNFYNFNIDRSLDSYIDEQGRRIYDPELTERNIVSARVDDLVQLNLQSERLPYLIGDELKSREYYENLKLEELQDFNSALDAAADPKYEGLGVAITPDRQVLVEHPDPVVRGLTTAGAMFASAIPGSLLAGIAGTVLYDVLGMPVDPASVAVTTSAAKAAGTGSLFMTPTFQAFAYLDPRTNETVTEQRLNIGGEMIDQRWTSESEFAAMREEAERLQEAYGSGDVVGDATAFAEAKTGTRKPSWRDYANTGFDFEKEVFNAFTGGFLPQMPDYIQDGAALTIALSSGQDPLTALINVYGEDVDDALGLSEMAGSAIDEIFPEQTAQFLRQNSDLVRLGADIVVTGKDPSEAIRERYGDKILDYMGADTPNLRAAGNAGLNVLVNVDKGMDVDEAVGKGVIDYFKQGGKVETLLEAPDTFSTLFEGVPSLDIDLSAFNVNLPNVNIPWKETWDLAGRNANELLQVFDVGDLLDFGFEIDEFNWDAIDTSGMSFSDFTDRGYNLTDLDSIGVELGDLDIDIPELEFELQLAQLSERIPGTKTTSRGEVVQPLTSEFDFLEDDDLSFSRQVLQRTV